MDGKTFKKMRDGIDHTYTTIEEMPSYWWADIKERVYKSTVSSIGNKLRLTRGEVKAAVMVKRSMVKAGVV